MLARKSTNLIFTKRLFHFDKCILNLNQKYAMSTVDNTKLFLTDQYAQFTFGELNNLSDKLSKQILNNQNTTDLKGEKIAVLCSNNYTYLVSLLAIWKANGVPLGLNKQYPINLLEYFINDSQCKLVINGIGPEEVKKSNTELDSLFDKKSVSNFKLIENEFYLNKSSESNENSLEISKRLLDAPENMNKEGLILYTSGTSGPPKGVILTRKNMSSTIETLKNAWEWTAKDKMLHVLPLNHVHGLSYGLLTSFYSGAECDMLPKFQADQVWSKLLEESNSINVFMAVPTIFVNLLSAYQNSEQLQKKYSPDYIKHIFKNKIRLVASGSAPLNVKTNNEWNELTGYSLLERYGMTEIGLGLSNPYRETKESKRVPGAVGRPFGETTVRIVEPSDSNKDAENVVVESYLNQDKIFVNDRPLIGELQVRGDMIFREYHGKPAQTKETFSEDGWFKTGKQFLGFSTLRNMILYFFLKQKEIQLNF
jgi:malonyl-CoA/methylmalonyl-CoA synthetase